MFIINSYALAVVFCFITMLCWGSWGNTQKFAGKTWRYELFYWDYVIGMVLFSLLLGFTMGSIGTEGRSFVADLSQANYQSVLWVILGGVIFNASNILLSASTSLAGLAVACRYGFELDNALEIAEKTYVNVNIHQKENADKLKDLAQLPDSCEASADCLESQRAIFEKHKVFSPAMIDGIIKKLRSYGDKTLRSEIDGNQEEMLKLVKRYFHCG